ncbi:MAG: MerR family transcriptional regulator [Alphaproteobacteria bacterium]|nr:MerR family transcriptional regulator [Alphaproteobacteria bacterium]MBU0798650.1 MerR family transcriptional regulator [Alphaproteobacteria bacterium]MBU0885913.1 MerR family transcriptional regulator [Alphaproteobacteria bacterium]MBU1811902.1 MerR family transcriptional regulator [Alphaproteobacteria bacterium]
MEKFGIAAVEAATGCTAKDIANWKRRNLLSVPLEPSGRGKIRGYSRDNIYEFALLSELSKLGIPLAKARGIAGGMRGKFISATNHWFLLWNPAAPDGSSMLRWEQIDRNALFPDKSRRRSVAIVSIAQILDDVDAALARFAQPT